MSLVILQHSNLNYYLHIAIKFNVVHITDIGYISNDFRVNNIPL